MFPENVNSVKLILSYLNLSYYVGPETIELMVQLERLVVRACMCVCVCM